MEAESLSKSMATTYKTTDHNIPDNSNFKEELCMKIEVSCFPYITAT
jgi:hypothetical protein